MKTFIVKISQYLRPYGPSYDTYVVKAESINCVWEFFSSQDELGDISIREIDSEKVISV